MVPYALSDFIVHQKTSAQKYMETLLAIKIDS